MADKAPGALTQVVKANAWGAIKEEAADAAGDKYGSLGRLGAGALLDPGQNAGAFVKGAIGDLASKGLKDLSQKKGFRFLSRLFGLGEETNYYSTLAARGDPQLVMDFAVSFPFIPPDSQGLWPGGVLPEEYIEDIDEPYYGLSDTSQFFNSGTMNNIPGFLSVSQFTARMYGEHKWLVQSYLNAWRELIVNDRGDYGLPYDRTRGYCKSINIIALLPTGESAKVAEIYGVFPAPRDLVSWNSSTSDRVIVSQTFVANGVRITIPSAEKPLGTPGSVSTGNILKDGLSYLKNSALKDAGEAVSQTANRFGAK